MRHAWIFVMLFCACRTTYDPPPGVSPYATVILRITAKLDLPSGCQQPEAIEAAVLIDGSSDECPLQVERDRLDLVINGECAEVSTGAQRTFTLSYFVRQGAQRVLVGESVGRADLVKPDSLVVQVVFDSSVASLKPKTEALSTETDAEKDRFNCDRLGVDRCANPKASGAVIDVDDCSNLEELCKGTLFSATTDDCP